MKYLSPASVAVACLWLWPAATWAQPTITHTTPGALLPGKTIELTLNGDKLDDPLRIWTSFPAQTEIVPGPADAKDQKTRVCKVTLDASVPVGIGGLVVGSASGASDVVLLLVDDLESVADNGANHALAQAQVIAAPSAIDGVADGTQFDYFKVAGKKDQRLSVEVVAARIGSNLDAVLRLLLADGSEVLLADDDNSFGADARFSVVLPADGEYVIELRDNQYRGGGRYRLRIGDFPLVTVPYPLGGRMGSTAQFQFASPLADSVAPVLIRIPDQVALGRVSVAAKYPNGKSSGLATVVASQLPEVLESEPNDELKAATPMTIPCAVNGHLQAAHDRDYFQFAALKDQTLALRSIARSLGSPTMLFMRVYNADGQQLAETAVNDQDEWNLSFKAPADGVYNVMVEDLLRRGGNEHAYRVEIEPQVGFQLAIKNEPTTKLKFQAPLGDGGLALTVQCDRQGYNGPIQLSLQAGAIAFPLINDTIPEGAKEHRCFVTVPPGATAGDLLAARLVGRATIDGREFADTAETIATLRAQRPQLTYPDEWLNGLLTVALGGPVDPIYATTPSAPMVPFDREMAKAEFTVALERKNAEFKDPITLLVRQLPAGFSSAVKAEGDKYTVTITGPKEAAAGKHALQLVSYGEFKGRGQIGFQEVMLEVAAPAAAAQ